MRLNDLVQRTRSRLSELDRQQQYYFYERLANPKAYDVLAEAGAFTCVTPPEVVEGRVLHYVWPPTLYLRNVVKAIPDKVAGLIATIDTENQRVVYDLVDLVRQLPAPLQDSLVDKLIDWLNHPQLDYISSNFVAIMTSLASNERLPASFSIARRLLTLLPKEDLDIPSLGYRSQSASAEFGDMAYDHIVEGIVNALLLQDPVSLVRLLADRLEEALDIEAHAGTNLDYSSIWAKSLTERPLGSGAKEVLAYRLFESLRQTLLAKGAELDSLLKVLEGRRWPLFKRMQVALLAEFGSEAAARAELTSENFMQLPELDRERDHLITSVYAKLDEADQTAVLGWINEALPSDDRLRDVLKDFTPPEELDDRIRRARERQLFERLKPISGFLHGREAALYSRLSEQFAGDDETELTGLWVGPTSPLKLEDLRAMPTPELMNYVEVWRSPEKQFAPSAVGLGLALSSIVEERANEFLANVERVLRWPPIYVLHVINALRKHINDGGFDIDAFVRLLSYVQTSNYNATGAQPKGAEAGDGDEDEASALGPSSGTTVALAITDVLRGSAMHVELKDQVWSILETLLNDPDPTTEDDLRSKADPAPWNASLNCVRGTAMLAVFDFARWLYRTNGGDANPPDMEALSRGLFGALECHLGPHDVSPAVRATYGQNFVSIYAMARDWTI